MSVVTPLILILVKHKKIIKSLDGFIGESIVLVAIFFIPCVFVYLSAVVFDPGSLPSPMRRCRDRFGSYLAGRPRLKIFVLKGGGYFMKLMAILHALGAMGMAQFIIDDPIKCERAFAKIWLAWLFFGWLWVVVPVAYMMGELALRRAGIAVADEHG